MLHGWDAALYAISAGHFFVLVYEFLLWKRDAPFKEMRLKSYANACFVLSMLLTICTSIMSILLLARPATAHLATAFNSINLTANCIIFVHNIVLIVTHGRRTGAARLQVVRFCVFVTDECRRVWRVCTPKTGPQKRDHLCTRLVDGLLRKRSGLVNRSILKAGSTSSRFVSFLTIHSFTQPPTQWPDTLGDLFLSRMDSGTRKAASIAADNCRQPSNLRSWREEHRVW